MQSNNELFQSSIVHLVAEIDLCLLSKITSLDMFQLVIAFCLVFGLVMASEKASFDKYRVYSIDVETDEQLQGLLQLQKSPLIGIDFWKSPSGIGRRSDIMVPPHQIAAFNELTEKLKLSKRVMVENVQT